MIYRRKPGGAFHYDFQYRGQRFRGSTKQTNEKKAQIYEAQRLVEAQDGLLGFRKVPTLKDYSTKFLHYVNHEARNTHGEPLDADTKRYYANGVRILLDSRYAKLHLDKIREYIPKDGINPATGNCVIRTLRRILGRAKQEGILRDFPVLRAFEDRERKTIYDDDLASKIVTMAKQPLRDVFLCVWKAGMRPEEVYRMRTDWIDWNNRVINVPDGKTKNSQRTIPMADILIDALVVRYADKKTAKTGWMFPARNKQSKSGHITNVAKQWVKLREDLGMSSECVLYCGRHTFGTNVMDGTKNIKIVMKVMGHNDLKTALRYNHSQVVETVRDAINKKPAEQEKTERVM